MAEFHQPPKDNLQQNFEEYTATGKPSIYI